MVGVGLTATVELTKLAGALTHPAAFVPLIVYTVVEVGLTVKLVPDKLPGNNVYVLAPDGVIIELLPEQIVPLLTLGMPSGIVIIVVSINVHDLKKSAGVTLTPDTVFKTALDNPYNFKGVCQEPNPELNRSAFNFDSIIVFVTPISFAASL